MKKGYSKNRHFSKGSSSKSRERTANRRIDKQRKFKTANSQLAKKDFKWSRIGTIIQLTDFLIDKVPQLVKWLFNSLGMG